MFTQSTLDQQQELNKFLDLISPSLKIKVQRHVFIGVLKNNKVLAQANEMTAQFNSSTSSMAVSTVVKTGDGSSIPMGQAVEIKVKQQSNGKMLSIKEMQLEEEQSNKDEFLQIFVSKLVTVLCIPEDQVVKQNEESYDMYFIAKGLAVVS